MWYRVFLFSDYYSRRAISYETNTDDNFISGTTCRVRILFSAERSTFCEGFDGVSLIIAATRCLASTTDIDAARRIYLM